MTGVRPPIWLKTWSSLGQPGRMPSEYEVVTHALNYTTRPNRTSALESNPTTAANMWYLTYRDKSPLQADDWLGFRDPDELTYRTYVTMQDEQETVVEGVLDEYGPAGHDATLPGPWVDVLGTLFTPTRFPVHALQMFTSYLGYMAPSSYVSNCSAIAAHGNGDELTRLLLGNLAADADRCARWSTALTQYAIGQRAGNRDVLQRWVARWTPRAEAAAAGLGALFGQLPSGGGAAEDV